MRVVTKIAASFVILLVSLAAWNASAAGWQHYRNPVPGEFHVVTGYQMHIDCRGTGSPTVVLEAAASAPWSEWRKVQPELSRITRICSYDRAGHGWSEPRPGNRDAATIVRELHSLLDAAGIRPPLVLVGHSAGGLYIREYAREFASEVSAVGLIESSSPNQLQELPGARASYEEDKREQWRQLWEDRLRVWSGWQRLVGGCSVSANDYPGWKGQYDAMSCRPGYVDTDDTELNDFGASCEQAARLTSFGAIPLLVISRDPDLRRPGISPRAVAQQPVWEHEQEQLKSLSPRSWRVIARNSGHMVPLDRPDVVIGQLNLLLGYLRGVSAPHFGTTTTE